MSVWVLVRRSLLAALLVAVVFAQPDAFDSAAFEQLSDREKIDFVSAVLEMRDAQLQNFAYEALDTMTNVSSDGKELEIVRKEPIGVKRKDNQLLFHAKRFNPDKDQWATIITAWDGSVSRALITRPVWENPRGTISDSEDSNFSARKYNEILGLRRYSTDIPMTMHEWFNDAAANNIRIDVDTVEQGGKPLLTFKVHVGREKYWEYYLDPARDFVPVRGEYRRERRGKFVGRASHNVTEAKEIDGFWVPTKVVQRTANVVSEHETQWLYEVSDFERGTVTDEDFEITFPPGTEVIDSIVNLAYQLLPGGGVKMLPLADAQTGEMINPPDTSAEDALEDLHKTPMAEQGPKNESIEPPTSQVELEPETREANQALASAPIAITKTRSNWFWVGIPILVVGVVVLILGVKRVFATSA